MLYIATTQRKKILLRCDNLTVNFPLCCEYFCRKWQLGVSCATTHLSTFNIEYSRFSDKKAAEFTVLLIFAAFLDTTDNDHYDDHDDDDDDDDYYDYDYN